MRKNLFLFFVVLLIFQIANAQDSIADFHKKSKQKFTEKDILVDQSDSVVLAKYAANFQENYKSKDFDYQEKIPEKSWGQKIKEWLGRWLSKIFTFSNPSQVENYVSNTLKAVAILVFAIAGYFIFKIFLNKEGSWIFGKSSKTNVEYDELEKNLQNIDFKRLIDETVRSGNSRLVIRYYYLWVLKKLSNAGTIEFIPEKTNSDYYNEIASEKTKSDFRYVSYLYNNIWYGEFELDAIGFEKATDSFQKMIQSIS